MFCDRGFTCQRTPRVFASKTAGFGATLAARRMSELVTLEKHSHHPQADGGWVRCIRSRYSTTCHGRNLFAALSDRTTDGGSHHAAFRSVCRSISTVRQPTPGRRNRPAVALSASSRLYRNAARYGGVCPQSSAVGSDF